MVQRKETKSRVEYLDMARGICILLVILGHQVEWDNPLRNVIYSFHMALFFILSGTVEGLTNGYHKPFSDFLKKKIKGLLVPYFLWSAIFALADLIRVVLKVKPANIIVFDAAAAICGYGINVLWFLSTLFTAHVLAYILFQKNQSKRKSFAVAIFAGIVANMIWNIICEKCFSGNLSPIYKIIKWCGISILRPVIVLPFLLIGLYLPNIFNKCCWINVGTSGAVFIVVNIMIPVYFKMKTVFVNIEFSNFMFSYIAGISGTVFIVLLCKKIYESGNSRIISGGVVWAQVIAYHVGA